MPFLVFNLALLAVDVCALVHLARNRRPGALVLSALAVGLAAAGLALGLGLVRPSTRSFGSMFTVLGLLACAIFPHGIPLLVAAGRLLWREQRAAAVGCLVVAALLVAAGVEGFVVEPRRLEVTRHRITSPAISRPLRLVVLADLQTDHVGDYERRAIRTALELEPDLLVLPGDYVQLEGDAFEEAVSELNGFLRTVGFGAPLGVIAVEGNTDVPGWERIFDGLPVTTFVETGSRHFGELSVVGIGFGDSFRPDLRLPRGPDDKGFRIAVGHAPDFARGEIDADLLIAGHTHGGQVCLPGFGPLMTLSSVPRAWASGRTELPGGRTLIVSRGIGMERGDAPRVRFFCRPELVVIDLEPAGPQ